MTLYASSWLARRAADSGDGADTTAGAGDISGLSLPLRIPAG
eukprot:CAMPEP_0173460250 /NCGR_PEP_ID=MMETSP1357-20121228/62804_1 /TAXON_ID=77926 /ORGANISM="Hemiselmis rufescens, Strain PCC563" /LENGTH=41 /DNA_ID= /DNA_START= /DNA_END= /DNA_ORIENTATION=